MDPSILLSAAPGLIGGLAQLFGKKRRNREEEAAMKKYRSLADVFEGQTDAFSAQLDAGFMNDPQNQSILTKLGQRSDDNIRSINSASAVGGLTDESKIAMMGRNNQAEASGIGNIAESAQRWRTMILGQRGASQGQQMSLNDRLYNAGQNNRRNFNQSLSNILDPLNSGISSYLQSTAQ